MTITYHLIEVKMNMKARKKMTKKLKKNKKKREMLRSLVLENFFCVSPFLLVPVKPSQVIKLPCSH